MVRVGGKKMSAKELSVRARRAMGRWWSEGEKLNTNVCSERERGKEKRGWRVYRVLALSPWRRDGDGNDHDDDDDGDDDDDER